MTPTGSRSAASLLCGFVLMIATCVQGYNNMLLPNMALNTLEFLQEGDYRFVVTRDCNLFVMNFVTNVPSWQSGTPGKGTDCVFTFQEDGDAVLARYFGVQPVWRTNTANKGGNLFALYNGVVAIYNANGDQIWSSLDSETVLQSVAAAS